MTTDTTPAVASNTNSSLHNRNQTKMPSSQTTSSASSSTASPSTSTTIMKAPYPIDVIGSNTFPSNLLYTLWAGVPLVITILSGRFSILTYLFVAALTSLPVFIGLMVFHSFFGKLSPSQQQFKKKLMVFNMVFYLVLFINLLII